MGKRLKRYFYDQFPAAFSELVGKNASVVLRDGVSIFGTIISWQGDKLLVEDKIPRKHYLEVKNIYEIVVDSEAKY